MVWANLGRLGRPLVVMLAVILVLVLVDVGIVAVRLTSGHPVGSQEAGQQDTNAAKHPCNHGNEVSRAAHQHKGGKHVSGVAKSKAGKNGACSSTSSKGGCPSRTTSEGVVRGSVDPGLCNKTAPGRVIRIITL